MCVRVMLGVGAPRGGIGGPLPLSQRVLSNLNCPHPQGYPNADPDPPPGSRVHLPAPTSQAQRVSKPLILLRCPRAPQMGPCSLRPGAWSPASPHPAWPGPRQLAPRRGREVRALMSTCRAYLASPGASARWCDLGACQTQGVQWPLGGCRPGWGACRVTEGLHMSGGLEQGGAGACPHGKAQAPGP